MLSGRYSTTSRSRPAWRPGIYQKSLCQSSSLQSYPVLFKVTICLDHALKPPKRPYDRMDSAENPRSILSTLYKVKIHFTNTLKVINLFHRLEGFLHPCCLRLVASGIYTPLAVRYSSHHNTTPLQTILYISLVTLHP